MSRLQKHTARAVAALRNEEADIQLQLDRVREVIDRLSALDGGKAARRAKGGRRLSPAGRAAISRAAKKRWAAYRRQNRAR